MKDNFKQAKFIAGAVFFAFGVIITQNAFGHGELLIRIAEVTRQIEAAANKSAKLYLERAELYRMDQNWTAAESDYARADKLAPNLTSIQICHAGMLADSGRLEDSRQMFTGALERSPKNGDAFIGRARVFVKLRQPKLAIPDFRRGLDLILAPPPEYFVELAEALVAEGAADDALSILDRGIKKLGPLPALETPAIDLELKRKKCNGALARIDLLLPQLLRKESCLARRGDILLESGRRADARKSYEDALVAINHSPQRIQ